MRNVTFRLMIGDLIMLALFVVLGKKEHGLEILNRETLFTAVPIYVAWLTAGWWTDSFQQSALTSLSVVTKRTFYTTLIAVPIGLIIRALLLDRGIRLLFFFVSLGFIFAFVCTWRFLYFWFLRGSGRASR